jgi:predicted AlkP superfamily phosphohydrolase/phosphomutase
LTPAKKKHRANRALIPALAATLLVLGAGCDSRPDRRVLVIGLDGATFSQLDPLLEQGLLPNLAALRDRGVAAELETTLPAISPPAWTSATTGVNPGKHNIFDFFHMSKVGPQAILTSALDRRARPIWYFLNKEGYRTGMMNIPMTYPPDDVDGFLISGFPYGTPEVPFTDPPELEAELGEYPRDLFGESLPAGHEGELLQQFRHTADRHTEVAKQLLTGKDWNLFWVVFTGTDKVQHFYWKYSDPQHPRYDPAGAERYGNAIREMYARLDQSIGELVELAGPETDVIVMSDHGFGPIYRELRLSNWLQEEGYFSPAPAGQRPWMEAYPPGPFSGLLRVAREDRDYLGQVPPGEPTEAVKDRLVEDLEALRDPETGEPVVESIYRSEDIFHGPYADNAPDVVFVERPEFFVGRMLKGDAEMFGLPSYTFSGFHRPTGVLFAAGPRIARRSGRPSYSILDIAPTLYWLFDVAQPEDLDGEVPTSLVNADSLAARPPAFGDQQAVIPPEDVEESEVGRQALESLGYVR